MRSRALLRVDDGDGRHVDDVGDVDAALEDVDRALQAEEDRADGLGAGEPPDQLVGGVGGLEVRKDQDVRARGRVAQGYCSSQHLRDDGVVRLHLAVDREIRARAPCTSATALLTFSALACVFEPKLENEIIATRGSMSKRRDGVGRQLRDLGELLGRRIDVDGRVGEEEGLVLEHQDVEARDALDAGRRAEDLQRRPDRVGVRLRQARDDAVGVAGVEHQRTEDVADARPAWPRPRASCRCGAAAPRDAARRPAASPSGSC